MKISSLFIIIVVLVTSACETQSQRSAIYAKKCRQFVDKGFLDVADETCSKAWFDVETDRLSPVIQSQRLYELARIKRQRQKYVEAEPLLLQSLAIEETVSGRTSTAYGLRLLELSLIMAGQSKWNEGSVFLKQLLLIDSSFSKQDQLAKANVLNHYASRLQNSDLAPLANLFKNKATELYAIGEE